MNGPGANYEPRWMNGSNHFQMRNDSNTEDAMKLIFAQGMGNGPTNFFYTDKK